MTLENLKKMAAKIVPATLAMKFEEIDGFQHVTLADDAEQPSMSASAAFDPTDEPSVVQAGLVDAVIRYTGLEAERAFAASVAP